MASLGESEDTEKKRTALKTTGLSLQPVWRSRRQHDTHESYISGYTYTHTFRVTVSDLPTKPAAPRISTVVDEALRAGKDATRLNHVGFSLSPSLLASTERQARAQAAQDAFLRASDYLGKDPVLIRLSEWKPGGGAGDGGGGFQPMMGMARMAVAEDAMNMAGDGGVPAEGGRVKVDVAVYAEYEGRDERK